MATKDKMNYGLRGNDSEKEMICLMEQDARRSRGALAGYFPAVFISLAWPGSMGRWVSSCWANSSNSS